MNTPDIDEAFAEVMTRRVGTSNLSHFEVFSIGHTVLNWGLTVQRLGHASPASTLDYTTGIQDLFGLVVRDFVAWTSGRTGMVPGDCRERFLAYLAAANWETHAIDGIPTRLQGQAS